MNFYDREQCETFASICEAAGDTTGRQWWLDRAAKFGPKKPELEALREENARLRNLVRAHEIDRDMKEIYERILTDIGKSVGCGHIDDNLTRCVSQAVEDGRLLRRHLKRLVDLSQSVRVDDAQKVLIDLGIQAKE